MTAGGKPNPLDKLKEIEELVRREEQQKIEQQSVQEMDDEIPEGLVEAVPDQGTDFAAIKATRQAKEDDYLKRINILALYKKLTGKEAKRSGGAGEKMIFCPASDHHNVNDEAACINVGKRTWVCYGQCDSGGGVIDMVAAAHGMPWGKQMKGADYAKAKQLTLEKYCGWVYEKSPSDRWEGKSPEDQKAEVEEFEKQFAPEPEPEPKLKPAPKIREEWDQDWDDDLPSIGKTKVKQPNGIVTQTDPPRVEVESDPTPQVHLESAAPVDDTEVTVVDSEGDEPEHEHLGEKLPELDGSVWDHVPEDTPLHSFLEATSGLPVPVEYNLFRGLQLLSLAAGPFVRGMTGSPFKTTLSVLFVGISGSGKSRSRGAMNQVLNQPAFHWITVPPNGTKYGTTAGVKQLIEPGSGEFLLQELSEEQNEGSNFKVRDVMADLEVDELARFMGKGNVTGSSLIGVFQEMDNNPSINASVKAGSRSGGKVIAFNPNLVFSAGVQPKAMGSLVGKGNIDNGFLARFEIVTGNYIRNDNPFERAMGDLSRAKELYAEVRTFYDPKSMVDGGKRELYFIRYHSAAKDYYLKHVHSKVMDMRESGDIKSRFDLKVHKLATLFAINRRADLIMKEDVDNAFWVLEYLNRASTLSQQKVVSTEANEIDKALISCIETWTKLEPKKKGDKGGYATWSMIKNSLKPETKGWDSKYILSRLQMLLDVGDVVELPATAARGRKVPRYAHADSLGAATLKAVKKEASDD